LRKNGEIKNPVETRLFSVIPVWCVIFDSRKMAAERSTEKSTTTIWTLWMSQWRKIFRRSSHGTGRW
jgi:hypothetical protein